MLTVALRVMGKEVSSKVDREVHEYGLVAGLKFVEGGVTLCDEAVAALELALDEVLQAKRMTEKSARRLAGIMQYSASAFEWSVSDQTWWSRHMKPICDAYRGAVFEWTEQAKDSVAEFRSRISVAPRLPCRPADLMEDGWRIVIQSDGSDVGVGSCLLLVKCKEDGTVTQEAMLSGYTWWLWIQSCCLSRSRSG